MIKTKESQEDLTYINSYISKVLKRNFGKGPATCFTTVIEDKMFIYLNQFITPAEEVLIKNDKAYLVNKTRSVIFETIFAEIRAEIHDVLGISYHHIHHDWNFQDNTGLIMLEASDSHNITRGTFNKDSISNAIQKICSEKHKIPEKISAPKMSSPIVYIEYTGFMSQIEQILYKKGYEDLLFEWAMEVKNTFGLNKRLFESCIQNAIKDTFVIFNFEHDKCTLVFYLK
ncbi:Na-translocating system protein MpsC family protein [Metabacillus sp. Hm71]|uniref:Na-translocating system protein MpsC family protein n=1 Tax=Metabacillus sp. Hm71 TaxID=3450743 RepID=UPI003F41F22C